MSHVMCHVSRHMSYVTDKVVKLISGGSVITGPTPSSYRTFRSVLNKSQTGFPIVFSNTARLMGGSNFRDTILGIKSFIPFLHNKHRLVG